MKKIALITMAVVFGGMVAHADPFGGAGMPGVIHSLQSESGRSFYDVQQLQSKAKSKSSYSEFKDFKQQQKEHQERVKKDLERQKRFEERVQTTTPQAQFVNDNGVIRIENN